MNLTYKTIDSIPDLRPVEITSAASSKLSFAKTIQDPHWKDHLFDTDVLHYYLLEIAMSLSNSGNWDLTASIFTKARSLLNMSQWDGIQGVTYTIFTTSYNTPYSLKIYDNLGNAIAATDTPFVSGTYGIIKIDNFVAPYTGTYYIYSGWNQGLSGHTDASVDVFADIDTASRYNKNISYELNVTSTNHAPTGTVNIIGDVIEGRTLTATNSLSDIDGLGIISYQWFSDSTEIFDANQATYKLTSSDVGKAISVKSTYTDQLGMTESVSSVSKNVNSNILSGTNGNDSLVGTEGNDKFIDGLGSDTLIGGLGDDTYYISNSKTKIIELASQGNDFVMSSISYTIGNNIETLSLGNNTIKTNINATGNASDNWLIGNGGNNVLKGLAGNDTLIGFAGKDTLTGGTGSDIFTFTSLGDSGLTSQTRDTVTDFKHTENDKIAIKFLDVSLSFVFIGNGLFSTKDATGQLRLDPKTGILYGSTNADSAPEFSILLSGIKSLVAEDFIL